jgi:hypothetical protein
MLTVLAAAGWGQALSKVRLSYDSGNAAAGLFGFGLAAQYSMTFNIGNDASLGRFLTIGYFAELEYAGYGPNSLFGAAGGVEFLGLWILNAQAGIGYINLNGVGQFGFFVRGLLEIALPLDILVHLGASIDIPTLGMMRVGIRAGAGYQF